MKPGEAYQERQRKIIELIDARKGEITLSELRAKMPDLTEAEIASALATMLERDKGSGNVHH